MGPKAKYFVVSAGCKGSDHPGFEKLSLLCWRTFSMFSWILALHGLISLLSLV
jgi:hypothetical protein